jgi:phosphoribosylformylglycinamidine synthase
MGGLENLGLRGVEDVRVGKHITLQVNADSEEAARQLADEASKKLLANQVMEFYEIEMIN